MSRPHFLLVTFPGQSHIYPALQFAKRLLNLSVDVTFALTICARKRMSKIPTLKGLTFAEFSDGYDDGFKSSHQDDINTYLLEIERRASEILSQLIIQSADQGRPVTCLVSTMPWAETVARHLRISSAQLWIQPASVLNIYYYYFKRCGELIKASYESPSRCIELPGLPLTFISSDLPSCLNPSSSRNFFLRNYEELIESLCQDATHTVLVNTFDALEPEALKGAVDHKLNLVAIGPLIPSAFLDGGDSSDTFFGADIFLSSEDCKDWLSSKPDSSVIYIAFGSYSVLAKEQMEEIAQGLLQSQRPFIWVIRESQDADLDEKEEDKLSCKEELEKLGMIVPWCSQVEVLSHPSLGCFLTHCGWNSTMESLVSGVPVVAFPQWVEQGTNAKLIEDLWKTGVRVNRNEDGIVGRDEIVRCLDMVMDGGEIGEEKRKNAKKWRGAARMAAKEGGSSEKNLKDFVNELRKETI